MALARICTGGESMKKVKKGKPIEETTKGSLEYAIYEVWRAFRQQVSEAWNYYICETFADHLIVFDYDLPTDEYWLVNYTKSTDGYSFDAREAWELVQLAYEPTRMPTADSRTARQAERSFSERTGTLVLTEAADGRRRVKAIGMTAGVINENMRRYPIPVVAAAVEEARQQLGNLAGRLGRGPLLGEAEHPSDKPTKRANLLETVVVWDSITFDGNQVLPSGYIVETTKGKDVLTLLEAGVYPGISLRGYGRSTLVKDNGVVVEEIEELHLDAFDLVLDPADTAAAITALESRHTAAKEHDMKGRRVPHLLQEADGGANPQSGSSPAEEVQPRALVSGEVLEAALAPAGLSDADRQMLDRLAQSERRRAVGEAIDQALANTPYSAAIRQQIAEAVRALDVPNVEAVAAAVERQRAVADALIAEARLAVMGRPSPTAPVISGSGTEGLVPEYARAQLAIAESLVRATGRPHHLTRLANPQSVNERFAVDLLAKFDRQYKQHLLREAREFQDAEQTTDLNLPYTIMRTVIAELVPELVAVSVFDVQTVDAAPTVNVPYETYTAESGLTATVTDESITSDDDTWVDLDKAHLTPGTVVLTSDPAGTTYVEGTDYVVDYFGGRVMTLSGGAINDAAALLIDYGYTALRKGEMQPIERGKMQLNFFPLTIAADRLATQISSEAVVFSRGVLGYDAVGRALSRIMFEVKRKIDGGLYYLALAESLRIASNSGGTWTAATDTYDDLSALIGAAKVKVANRFFMPTGVLMSITNADRMANWIGFTQAGSRPDADLNSAGYVGRLKGLPVFASTEFSDGYDLVVNREVVYYRIAQAMQLRGPFPTYNSDGKLIAADQYYVEEYNGMTGDPGHSGKASYVKIV
jgi:hypothetical protein